MKQLLPLLVVCAVALAPTPRCTAQNVSGYGMMPNPFLFLLREPAVHDDLGLTQEERGRLIEINRSFDGELLATRNMPAEKSQERIVRVMAESEDQVAKLFSGQQQSRMRQIAYRLKGMPFVLDPQAAEQMKLTSRQKTKIESIVTEAKEEISGLDSRTYQGKEAHQKSQKAIAAALKKEHQAILGTLTDSQKQRLVALVGRTFDSGRLGHVSFKAPELSTGDEWINSKPLQLADLRGKVVALHFYAFG